LSGNGSFSPATDLTADVDDLIFDVVGPPPVPSVTSWGLIAMVLLMLSLSTVALRRRGMRETR
jgi:hypothetical protein